MKFRYVRDARTWLKCDERGMSGSGDISPREASPYPIRISNRLYCPFLSMNNKSNVEIALVSLLLAAPPARLISLPPLTSAA